MLFDWQGPRVDTEPADFGEPHFKYLNRSARSDAAAVRELLESWFEAYPAGARPDLLARFRSPDRYTHYSAFFELYSHALLSRVSPEGEVRRGDASQASTRAPDFTVVGADATHFFVEATVATNLSAAEMAAEQRLNQVYDALNGIDSPNFFIGAEVHGAPDRPVPGRPLRRRIEEFVRALDPDEVSEMLKKGGLSALPQLRVEIEGWRIDIMPLAKSPEARGKPGIRPLGMMGPAEMAWVDDSSALRDAVIEKATHYGDLGRPLVVAVNAVNQHLDMTDVMEALFGKETYTVSVGPESNTEPTMSRRPNGAWHNAQGPVNTRVSALLVGSSIIPWSVAAYTPEVYHNPYARYPLAGQLDLLPHYRPMDGKMIAYPGRSAADLFGLPVGWPTTENARAV
jgi:hypothetical protein